MPINALNIHKATRILNSIEASGLCVEDLEILSRAIQAQHDSINNEHEADLSALQVLDSDIACAEDDGESTYAMQEAKKLLNSSSSIIKSTIAMQAEK
jgi:hypothetical protein